VPFRVCTFDRTVDTQISAVIHSATPPAGLGSGRRAGRGATGSSGGGAASSPQPAIVREKERAVPLGRATLQGPLHGFGAGTRARSSTMVEREMTEN